MLRALPDTVNVTGRVIAVREGFSEASAFRHKLVSE
jgi:starvation-inducible outer membrane lipoprotein